MQIQLTKKQIVFLVTISVIVLVVALVLFGVIPGRRAKDVSVASLEFWGIDDKNTWEKTIEKFQSAYPAEVTYRHIDEASYETYVINALAAGNGPDVFMFDNNWLFKHKSKIVPTPPEKLSLSVLQSLFPQVVEQDYVLNDRIYALPLYIDTLILAYNRSHFDQGAIVTPPATWLEFNADIPVLRKLNGANIERAAFAIGGSSSNISNAPDLLNLFLMQSGIAMVNKDLDGVLFNKDIGHNAFAHYVSYINPNLSDVYTWNNKLGRDLELFAEGNASGVFVYSAQLDDIRLKNALVDVGVGAMPQVDSGEIINYPDYYGLAVANSAEEQNVAWDFVIFATTDQTSADAYSQNTGLPPALKFLIALNSKGLAYVDFVKLNEYQKAGFLKEMDERENDPGKNGILARQALTAQSWIQPDPELVKGALNKAIESILNNSLTIKQALNRANAQITDLLRAK
jgi:multiple sugar transport system substrate-binding protein